MKIPHGKKEEIEAGHEGVEPPTNGLRVRRSTWLSQWPPEDLHLAMKTGKGKKMRRAIKLSLYLRPDWRAAIIPTFRPGGALREVVVDIPARCLLPPPKGWEQAFITLPLTTGHVFGLVRS